METEAIDRFTIFISLVEKNPRKKTSIGDSKINIQ
jgi:hypothetical protein